MVLNDLERCILATKAMQYSEKDSMDYLKKKGFKIVRSSYYRILGHISVETRKRAYEIAKNFLEDHIDTVDELNHIKKLMYEQSEKEKDPLKKTMILAKITETMIPYISAYREATKKIIEKVKKEVEIQEKNMTTAEAANLTRRNPAKPDRGSSRDDRRERSYI